MKRSALLALILVYAAMFAANWVSVHIFERLPHLEDEIAYLYQARIFDHGDIYIQTPEPRRAYWQPFVIDCNQRMEDTYDVQCDGRRFGKYAPGWSMLLAVGTGNNAPWMVNVWLAGLVVALVYRLGREIYGAPAGVVSALLMTISPIAWILNGSLMGHTAALFFTLLFIYGLWRLERKKHILRWGAVAGVSLGFLIASRPLTAIGVAAPFILYSGVRVLVTFAQDIRHKRRDNLSLAEPKPLYQYAMQSQTLQTLPPLLVVMILTLLIGALYPAFNYATTGKADANLYQFIWDYDQIGFGEGHGRSGHTLEKAKKNTKRDTQCYVRDLFGWVMQPDNPPNIIDTGNECVTDKQGLSLILLLPAFLLMPRRQWSLLMVACAGFLIAAHMAYWIGAGVYSARYYYEGTGALAIVSGAGVAGLIHVARRWQLEYGVYILLGIAVTFTLVSYIPKRLAPIQAYGCIDRRFIDDVERLRYAADIPVMVVAYGDQNWCKGRPSWRDYGALMAITDPIDTESDILFLRDPDENMLPELMEKYPDRQLMMMRENTIRAIDQDGRAGY